MDIVQKRLTERARQRLAADIEESRLEFSQNRCQAVSVESLMDELLTRTAATSAGKTGRPRLLSRLPDAELFHGARPPKQRDVVERTGSCGQTICCQINVIG
ncbi:MAG: hypothetical protein WCI11_16980 [Candidatus Methylumidiphilus sp.]